VSSTICALRIQPREIAQYSLKQTLSMDLCLLPFIPGRNAGLQDTAIYFDLKDSLYKNPDVFSTGCTLQRF